MASDAECGVSTPPARHRVVTATMVKSPASDWVFRHGAAFQGLNGETLQGYLRMSVRFRSTPNSDQ